jgi:hypothetical protein
MNFLKMTLAFIFISGSLQVKAQEVTDYDLQNFARAYKEMVQLNTKAQKKMAEIIADEGLDLEVYHAIDDTKNTDFEPDVPKSDFDKYEKVQPKIKTVQQKLEKDVEKAYAKYDLTKQKYTAIAERVKQDYMLQAKLEQIFEKMGR